MGASDFLLDMASRFLPDKKAEREALEKFLILWRREGHDPLLAEYYFAQATGHRYASYREIQFIMNTTEPLKTLWMYKRVNRSQSVVRFNGEGQAETTDRARWRTRCILIAIDIAFVLLFLFTSSSTLNDMTIFLDAFRHMTVSATLMLSLTASILEVIISVLILLMTAFVWWDVLNARYFADFYNANRC